MNPEDSHRRAKEEWVAVATPAPLLAPLTYRVPPHLAGVLTPGVRVRIPLGARRAIGVVLATSGPPPPGVEAKDVIEALDEASAPALPPDLLATVCWAVEHYLAPPGDVIRAALPAALAQPIRKTVRLTDEGRRAARDPGAPEALRWLARQSGGRALRESFLRKFDRPSRCEAAIRAGWVVEEQTVGPARGAPVARQVRVVPDAAQSDPDAVRRQLSRAAAQRRLFDEALAGPPRTAAELARAAAIDAQRLWERMSNL
jgi:primosomal protein N' (replication factor Y)